MNYGNDIDSVLLMDERTHLLNKAREALTQAESQQALLSTIVECSEDAIYSESLDETVVSWNAAAERIFGYTAEEIIGKKANILVPQEQRADYLERHKRIHRGERFSHFEATRLQKGGEKIWVSISLAPLRNNEGQVVGISKIVRDITERKKRDEELAIKERILREISQGVLITDANQRVLYTNPMFEWLTGYDLEEARGRDYSFLQGPDTEPETVKELSLALSIGKSFNAEILNYRKNGTTFWNDFTISPMHDDHGRIIRFIGILRDVSERKRMHLLLSESEQWFRSLFTGTATGIAVSSPDGRLLQANAAYCKMLGYSEEELRNQDCTLLTHPEDLTMNLELREEVIAGKRESYVMEKRYLKKSGDFVWASHSVSVVRGAGGKITKYIIVAEDITERKRVESRFRLLVESNAQSIFFWNSNGEIFDANDSFLNLTGYTRKDIESGYLTWVGLTPPEYAHHDRHALEEMRINNVCTPYEKEFIRKDGSRVPILIGAAVFTDSKESGVCFVLDITRLKDAEQKLKKALEDQKTLTRTAQAALEAKSQFLAVMSHEIRIPMHGMLGFAELLRFEDSLSPEAQEHLQTILKSGESLLHIIDDILDYSRIDAGKLVIEKTLFSIHDLVADLKNLFEFSIWEKGLSFESSADTSIPLEIIGDSGRIRQVLLNLIGNAIKFTTTGSIALDISRRRLDSGDFIEFRVRDTGEGIEPEKQGMIFEAFTQADSTASRRYGGSGLGLAISNRLAKLMGGLIELKSQPGEGSTFSLLIPQ